MIKPITISVEQKYAIQGTYVDDTAMLVSREETIIELIINRQKKEY